MAKTILIAGYGPGISHSLAEKFGAEGFAVALVARNGDRLAAGVKALEAKGVKAASFQADLADPKAITEVVARAKAQLGPIDIVQWNAYGSGAGDLLASDASEVRGLLDLAVTGGSSPSCKRRLPI